MSDDCVRICRTCGYTKMQLTEILAKPDWTPATSEWRIINGWEMNGRPALRFFDGNDPHHSCDVCGAELCEFFVEKVSQ